MSRAAALVWCRVDDGEDSSQHRLRAVVKGRQRRSGWTQVAARAREPGVVAATTGAVAQAVRVRRLRAHAREPLLSQNSFEKEVAEACHAPAGPPPTGLGASFLRSVARVAAADAFPHAREERQRPLARRLRRPVAAAPAADACAHTLSRSVGPA